jgi:predicted  nucleic acid-binding Zn-ribbon protein
VAGIEAEAQQLREAVINKQTHVKTLERRVETLSLEVQELAAKVQGD